MIYDRACEHTYVEAVCGIRKC